MPMLAGERLRRFFPSSIYFSTVFRKLQLQIDGGNLFVIGCFLRFQGKLCAVRTDVGDSFLRSEAFVVAFCFVQVF